jgi:hypothetical protein
MEQEQKVTDHGVDKKQPAQELPLNKTYNHQVSVYWENEFQRQTISKEGEADENGLPMEEKGARAQAFAAGSLSTAVHRNESTERKPAA